MRESRARLDPADLFNRIHSFNHLAENGIAIAIGLRMVEASVVDRVDEKLRSRGVGVAGAGHCEPADIVAQTIL